MRKYVGEKNDEQKKWFACKCLACFCGYGSRFSKWSSMRFAYASACFHTFFVFVCFTSSEHHFVCQNVLERNNNKKNHRIASAVSSKHAQLKRFIEVIIDCAKMKTKHGCEQKAAATWKKRIFSGEVTTVKNRIRISRSLFPRRLSYHSDVDCAKKPSHKLNAPFNKSLYDYREGESE